MSHLVGSRGGNHADCEQKVIQELRRESKEIAEAGGDGEMQHQGEGQENVRP